MGIVASRVKERRAKSFMDYSAAAPHKEVLREVLAPFLYIQASRVLPHFFFPIVTNRSVARQNS